MARPFKFRYANEIVGSFVLLIALLLIVAVLAAGHAQKWFEPVHRVDLQFPPEGSFELQRGAEVRILGTLVGTIEEIMVNEDDGSMQGVATVRGEFIRFVREGSQAVARKKFGIAGDAYLEITKGTGPELADRPSLVVTKDKELTELVQDVLRQVKEATLPAIDQIRKAVEEYTLLAAGLRDPKGELQMLIANISAISDALKKGESLAGKLLSDPTMGEDIALLMRKLNDSASELKTILDDVQVVTSNLKDEAGDLPGVVLQARDAVRETQTLVEGIQKHWLIRAYVEQAAPSTLIPPSEVQAAGEAP